MFLVARGEKGTPFSPPLPKQLAANQLPGLWQREATLQLNVVSQEQTDTTTLVNEVEQGLPVCLRQRVGIQQADGRIILQRFPRQPVVAAWRLARQSAFVLSLADLTK